MILRGKVGKLKMNLVLRYMGDSQDSSDRYYKWKEKKLGIWWKTYTAVGTKYKGKRAFKKENMAPGFMLGFNLIWANLWLDFSYGVLTFNTNDSVQ
jgi:hypothetical protein